MARKANKRTASVVECFPFWRGWDVPADRPHAILLNLGPRTLAILPTGTTIPEMGYFHAHEARNSTHKLHKPLGNHNFSTCPKFLQNSKGAPVDPRCRTGPHYARQKEFVTPEPEPKHLHESRQAAKLRRDRKLASHHAGDVLSRPIENQLLLRVVFSIGMFLSVSMLHSVRLFVYLSVYQSYLCLLFIYLSTHLSIHRSIYPSICLSICLSTYLTIYLSLYLIIRISAIYLSIYPSAQLSMYLTIYLSLYLCLSACMITNSHLNMHEMQAWMNACKCVSVHMYILKLVERSHLHF